MRMVYLTARQARQICLADRRRYLEFDSRPGKLKGVTGKGTYKGTAGADGTMVAAIEWEYFLAFQSEANLHPEQPESSGMLRRPASVLVSSTSDSTLAA